VTSPEPHAGIVLIGIAVDVLAGGAAHEQLAAGVPSLEAHSLGLVHQNAIRNDFCFQTRRAKLGCHVFGGLAVSGGRSQMRLGGERLQSFAGQKGVRDGEKLLLDFRFSGEVAVAEDGGSGLRGVLRRKGSGNERQKKKKNERLARDHQ